jgi:hypothetical protein
MVTSGMTIGAVMMTTANIPKISIPRTNFWPLASTGRGSLASSEYLIHFVVITPVLRPNSSEEV